MKHFYVIGGQQKSPRALLADDQNWYEYKKGVILRVNTEAGTAETCIEYVSPSKVRGPEDPILFKAGSIDGNLLYACTQTELLTFRVPSFELVDYLSLRCFNDIHHVRPTLEGNFLVANSGLEMVLEISRDGQIIREWNVFGEDPWANFSKQVDYRKGVNLKPHRGHPNYVFYVGEEIWTTRFEQRDAVSLTHSDRCLHIGIERVHDGVLHRGSLYFTTTNGNLVVANPDELEIEECVDLNSMHDENTLLGWCRGLWLQGDLAWIGFSRIRPTKFREAVSWVRQGFSRSLPTHIACYDLKQRRCLAEIDLEEFELNAVFSILPAE